MKRLLSCEFNFDTVCVELRFSDSTMIAIDKGFGMFPNKYAQVGTFVPCLLQMIAS